MLLFEPAVEAHRVLSAHPAAADGDARADDREDERAERCPDEATATKAP